jgi:hypothetical protein
MKLANLKLHRLFILVALVGLVVPLAMLAPTASADGHEFYLSLYHGINGRSLGLDKDLPVDVYVNTMPGEGDPAIEDFTFKTRIEDLPLPAGEYVFYVTLADSTQTIMQFPPSGKADIPGGVDVSVHAKLSAEKTPTLKVMVK